MTRERSSWVKRVYKPWNEREEFSAGMWRKTSGEEYEEFSRLAFELMANPSSFKAAMTRVVAEWPNSTLHNLTAIDTNRRAWLGHAGCFLGVGSPEEPTRIGWHKLSKKQQFEADRAAQEVIDAWESSWAKKGQRQIELFPELIRRPKGRTSTNA